MTTPRSEMQWKFDAHDLIAKLVSDDGKLTDESRYMLLTCLDVWWMLHQKNKAYGNSALNPVRIFSRADRTEQIRVRIDDKLSRLSRGSAVGEDATWDLLGYLILLRVAEEMDAAESFFEPDKFHERTVPTHPRLNPALSEDEKQRRSFAYGNAKLANEDVTRAMVDEAAERLDADDGRVWKCGACGNYADWRTSRCDCGAPKPAWSGS